MGFSLYGIKTVPVLDALDHVARIGYRQVEFAVLPRFPTDPAQFSTDSRRAVRVRLDARGLRAVSFLINIVSAGDARAYAANLAMSSTAGELAQ